MQIGIMQRFRVQSADNIALFQHYFTDATAELIARYLEDPGKKNFLDEDKIASMTYEECKFLHALVEQLKKFRVTRDNILFVSDMRSISPENLMQEMSEECSPYIEERVMVDMLAQKSWVLTIRPRSFMLKFRLPFVTGKTEYLAGKIHFQLFAGGTSTECRLISSCTDPDYLKIISYDHDLYCNRMFYFNTVVRPSYFPFPPEWDHLNLQKMFSKNFFPLDHCYDCSAELYLWKEWLQIFRGKASAEEVLELSQQLSETL